jgi:undecaprenyl-phosphate 4-deoxy-4-formamido-L-arabinose transferase
MRESALPDQENGPHGRRLWPSVSVVIPVFNGSTTLPDLVERVKATLDPAVEELDMVLVNDGSQDTSWEVIRRLAAPNSRVRGVNLMRNYGQHNALLCGVREAQGEIIVTMDDDLQHPPEEIPKLLQLLGEGFDLAYGTPLRESHRLWRAVASRVTKLALKSALGTDTARKVSAFRAFRHKLLDAFANYRGSFVSLDVLLTWGTTKVQSVQVRHDPRPVGGSNYTFGRLVKHAINMSTGFSTLPLQFASFVGFAFTLFGLAVLAYVLVRYFIEGGSVPGFPFLASIIALFSGAQLFALGIIGEYLARMHFRLMDRSAYAVRERTP